MFLKYIAASKRTGFTHKVNACPILDFLVNVRCTDRLASLAAEVFRRVDPCIVFL